MKWRLSNVKPTLGIVLGSGFAGAVSEFEELGERRMRGLPKPSVAGHAGRLFQVEISNLPILVLSGRYHYYEGFTMEQITAPIRLMAGAGVRDLLLTNAAGAINKKFRRGDFMRLTDHINFMGANPLRGKPRPGTTRFVDLTAVYDPELAQLLDRAAKQCRVTLHRGVYLAVSGPSYETPAEIRAFRRLGADAMGMSTVPEAIVARQCGMRVAGLSCITNLAAGLNPEPLSHAEVLATGKIVQKAATDLLRQFAELYAEAR